MSTDADDFEKKIQSKFRKLAEAGRSKSNKRSSNSAIVAVKTLMFAVDEYNGSTFNGLIADLKEAVKVLERIPGKAKLAVSSASAQFIRFTTLNLGTIEHEDMTKFKQAMLGEGSKYLKRCENSGAKISKLGTSFIFDGARVMIHSHSRVVLETLRQVPENTYFTVYIVSNEDTPKSVDLTPNIECFFISDAEVGTRMESIDLVLVGAEAVVKNGGIINKVGTLPLAICAKEMNKPLYVLAESFKFSLLYPLNQSDIPRAYREDPSTERIRVDYTPPKYLTLLITDRGLLTPVAVCDELIEMYT